MSYVPFKIRVQDINSPLTRLGIEGLYGGADGKNKSFKSRIST